jgi:flagellin
MVAQNQVNMTTAGLQKTLFRLASGSRINTGADDAAGLAIADGLKANISSLSQSVRNAADGTGNLQVADGALGQVTSLLNRAVTLATQSATGTVSDTQRTAINAEYTAILAEIDRIGTDTNFNGAAVFSGAATDIFLSDGGSNSTISTTVAALTAAGLGLAGNLSTSAAAITELALINTAVGTVAGDRGAIGAVINRLESAVNVMNAQLSNLSAAEDGIRAADMGQEVSNLSRLSVLNQTGMAALAQANGLTQSVIQLLG